MPKIKKDKTIAEIYGPVTGNKRKLPLYVSSVPAGFPSPADDFIDKKLDLNEHMVKHPAATFFVRVQGNSMIDEHIQDGDFVIVESREYADNGDMVVAVIDTGIDWEHSELNSNLWVNTTEYNGTDGVDDDHNGYVDDIAGGDFFGDDNDAWPDYDTGYGTHGTGVAESAAAEGNDGDGDIGVCPGCSVLPIRVGDTFVVDGGRLGEAIAYAVDNGARVLSCSWSTLGYDSRTLEERSEERRVGKECRSRWSPYH